MSQPEKSMLQRQDFSGNSLNFFYFSLQTVTVRIVIASQKVDKLNSRVKKICPISPLAKETLLGIEKYSLLVFDCSIVCLPGI